MFEPDSDIAVQMCGDEVAIRYLSRLEIVPGGYHSPLDFSWHTDLYQPRAGHWQIVWSQATTIR